MRTMPVWIALVVAAVSCVSGQPLTQRNTEVPFCYVRGGMRSWPILRQPLPKEVTVRLSAIRDGDVLAKDGSGVLDFEGFRVLMTQEEKLQITSGSKGDHAAFDLAVQIFHENTLVQEQIVQVRPAPATRPVTYYADFGDDLINIFGAGWGRTPPLLHHQLREGGAPVGNAPIRTGEGLIQYDKAGFDQYFRRLQCQGVAREIFWLFPFPLITDASVYDGGDWEEFVQQARAIIRSPELNAIVEKAQAHSPWGWLRDLMVFRLDKTLHKALSDSAIAHGITLAMSYRPFEQGASKYYQIPVFDFQGNFLRYYQPLSSPIVNAHPEDVGFAHYRELLARMGRGDDGQPTEIELPALENAESFVRRFRNQRDNLRILASRFPPIQSDSFVLVRQPAGGYELTAFRNIQAKAESRRLRVNGFKLVNEGEDIRITGLRIPADSAFILIDSPTGDSPLVLSSQKAVRLRNKRGVELGRNASYFSFPETSNERKNTRVAGITHDGGFNTTFFSTEASAKYVSNTSHALRLDQAVLVIHRGEKFSSEMVDFNMPRSRATAIHEIQGVLKHPAFREIYINTRSHTQLAADSRDGADGVQLWSYYVSPKQPSVHLGLDLAYAPQTSSRDINLRKLSMTDIANFRKGEWSGHCQSAECTYSWRLTRNRNVAAGIRSFLLDLRQAFPMMRIQVVVPEREAVARAVAEFQKTLPADSVGYTAGRYNYLPNIGEGMALLDLTGTDAAPALLGVGAFVSPPILDRYLDAALKDLSGNHGSSFRGGRSIMYEGQYGLRDENGRRARE